MKCMVYKFFILFRIRFFGTQVFIYRTFFLLIMWLILEEILNGGAWDFIVFDCNLLIPFLWIK